jgi:hypothetical protein
VEWALSSNPSTAKKKKKRKKEKKPGMEEMFLNIINVIYDKPIASFILKGEKFL